MKLTKLKYNPDNPRRISPEQLDRLIKSIESLPKMMELRPIVYDPNTMYVLGGNQRLAALRKMGKTEVPDTWVKSTDEMTEKEKREFILRDNVQSGEWDYGVLEENFADFDLDDIGIELPDFADNGETPEKTEHASLADKFIVPPFSVLDQRQGYWQARRKAWLGLGIQSECGRPKNLLEFSNLLTKDYDATSIFDPVLCEIIYTWFINGKGKILDPFAGGSVRGIVASILGHNYTGIDLSEQQIIANREQAAKICNSNKPEWIVGDSAEMLDPLDSDYDLLFSCPPYFDLEIYSDSPNDLSAMKWDAFLSAYTAIINKSVSKLKEGGFACFVISDIRGKQGEYRNFLYETIGAFNRAGLKTYNYGILVGPIGSLPIRINKQWQGYRKLGRCHQDILVFYKGDIAKIKGWNPIDVLDSFDGFGFGNPTDE